MVIKMRFRRPLILAVLILAGCATQPPSDRVSINPPVLVGELQTVRSFGELAELKRRYAAKASMTVAKALESYVPADYTVFPDAGIDLSRSLVLDRFRTWSQALPAALYGIGIEMNLDPKRKTIRLKQINGGTDSRS